MRDGWKIRKLGDIGTIVGGSTPKTNIPSYWGGDHYWITPAELDGAKFVGETERTLTEEALTHTNLPLLPVGTVLLSSRAPIGKVAITTVPMFCNQGFKNIICGPDINNEFVYWFLKYNKDYLVSLGRGATFKEISKHIVEQVSIPIPPIAEQEKIVAELDCLTGIIEKKKQQLEELDKLAQSIFYDMFGDPINNEKGWEMKKLGEIADTFIGLTYKPENVVDAGGTIVLRSSNIQESELDLNDVVRVSVPIKEKHFVRTGDILMCSRNGSFRLVGKVARIKLLPEEMSFGAFMTIIRSRYNDFLFSFFKSPAFRSQLTTAKTATINQITTKMLDEISVSLPPLDLQDEFAQKIEAIEKQKELAKQSIVETETLFNSRMDYWFN